MNIVAQFPIKDNWLAQCISENGKALPIVTNALVALRRDANISDAFAYDEMQRCVMLTHEIGQPLAPFDIRPVGDEDITVLSLGPDKKEGTADDIRIPDNTPAKAAP